MSLRLYYGDGLARYGFGAGHPFGPDRLHAFWRVCTERGLDRRADVAEPVMAGADAIRRFHTPDYVDRVRHQSRTGQGYLDYGDTPAFVGVYEAAATVVGTTLEACRQVLIGPARRAFVPIAGLHHARRHQASGFCVFNDIGCAIEMLRAQYGIRRIAYVDIDAHHGDGVFYAYEDDPELIIADIHEDGRYLYPGTGATSETGSGEAAGTKFNVPMQPGDDDEAFRRVWPDVEKFIRAAQPEFIILQAGADSVAGDPITHLRYTPAIHGYVARRLREIADIACEGRLVATGGGGYNRDNLARAWCAVVESLLD